MLHICNENFGLAGAVFDPGATTDRYDWNEPGLDWSSYATRNVYLSVPNTAPTASNGTVTTDEDTAHTFAADDFSFSDTDSGDTLSLVEVVTLPSDGDADVR